MAIRTKFGPFSIIVAVDECGSFAKDGQIPWIHEPFAKKDLKHFQKMTKGSICVMGRNTYDDMLAMKKKRPKNILPNRQSFVITSRPGQLPGAERVSSLRDLIHDLDEADTREIFILGGRRLFIEAMPFTNKVYMTIVPGCYDGDLDFPINSLGDFTITHGRREDELKFVIYERVLRR